MSQGLYPLQYEQDTSQQKLTKLAGLPPFLEFAQASGLLRSIEQHLRIRTNTTGWTDCQLVATLILLNIAGGESVSDLKILEQDQGLVLLLRRTPLFRWSNKTDGNSPRWPKGRTHTFPSPSATFRYLDAFHEPAHEAYRQHGKAFIPQANQHLRAFHRIQRQFLQFVQEKRMESTATLDMDALLIPTNKREALYCYKKYKAYQPLNIWWAEQHLVLYTEFRDGNVPANFELLRVFHTSLHLLPMGVTKVQLRSDSAGYQHELLRYCENGENARFGRIEFAVACDVTDSFREAVLEVEPTDWKPFIHKTKEGTYTTHQQWAEVCYVPAGMGLTSKSPVYRFLALREPLAEQKNQKEELPFPTIEMNGKRYKLFGRVTNKRYEENPQKGEKHWDGNDVLNWLNERCGKDEESHSVLKSDLAGGRLPSGNFGANAAWWWITILSMNLNNAFKRMVLGEQWLGRRMKSLRFEFINIGARVLKRGRQVLAKIERDHPNVWLLMKARERILELAYGP